MTPEELLKEVGEPFGYMIPHYADYPDVFFKHPLPKGYSALMARTKLYTSNQVAAAIAKAEQRVAEWQPIETAPKDGSFILLATPKGRIADGFWSLVYGVWSWPYVMVEPTHWMPLPTPPKRSMEGV